MDANQPILLFTILAMLAFVALIFMAISILLIRPWLRAFLHGAPVSLLHIIAMRLRGNPPTLLIDAYIALQRANIRATLADVENTYIDTKNQITTSDDLVAWVKQKPSAR